MSKPTCPICGKHLILDLHLNVKGHYCEPLHISLKEMKRELETDYFVPYIEKWEKRL